MYNMDSKSTSHSAKVSHHSAREVEEPKTETEMNYKLINCTKVDPEEYVPPSVKLSKREERLDYEAKPTSSKVVRDERSLEQLNAKRGRKRTAGNKEIIQKHKDSLAVPNTAAVQQLTHHLQSGELVVRINSAEGDREIEEVQ